MYLKSETELKEMGIARLPRTLGEAVDAFADDPLSEKVFGTTMRDTWLAYKRDEWLSYLNHVSDWEHARYLKFF